MPYNLVYREILRIHFLCQVILKPFSIWLESILAEVDKTMYNGMYEGLLCAFPYIQKAHIFAVGDCI